MNPVSWKKTGQAALSIGYFTTLLLLFIYIAIQGPIVVAKGGPSAESILRNNLFPFGLEDMGLLNSPTFGMINFAIQILLGFFSAYLMGRTFQRFIYFEFLFVLAYHTCFSISLL